MKKKLLLFAVIIFCISAVYAEGNPKVSMIDAFSRKLGSYTTCEIKLDGEKLISDVPAIFYSVQGKTRTLVPIRAISEALGTEVFWKKGTQEIFLTKGDKKMILKINSPNVKVNGEAKTLPDRVPAKVMEYNGINRTLVPIRFVTEEFGLEVNWIQETKSVELVSSKYTVKKEEKSDKAYENYKDDIHRITSISLDDDKNPSKIKVLFDDDNLPKYKEFYLKGENGKPDRLVIDFDDTEISEMSDFTKNGGLFEKAVGSEVISKIRFSQFSINPTMTARIVVDFNKVKQHKMEKNGDNIVINILKDSSPSTIDFKKSEPVVKNSSKCFKYEVIKSGQFAVLKFSPGYFTKLNREKLSDGTVVFEAEKENVVLTNIKNKYIRDSFVESYSFDVDNKENNRLVIKPKSGVEIYENPNTVNKNIHEIVFKIPSSITDYSGGKVTVVLDPGHGGSDPGAQRTDRNVREVDIIDKNIPYLKAYLEELGYRVLLTRDIDKFVSLYARVKYAELLNADLLVSVHANTVANKNVNGVEVFANMKRSDKSETVKLAKSILDSMIEYSSCQRRGVKDYNLYITREAAMTSTLVELGFMSNDAELNKMLSNDYSKGLAYSIANGINDYVLSNKSLASKHNGGGKIAKPEPELKKPVDESVAKAVQVDNSNNLIYPDMLEVMVNKKHRLPSYYEPSDLVYPDVAYVGNIKNSRLRAEAAKALENLVETAENEENIEYNNISAYRSYYEQKSIYDNSVAVRGEEETKKIIAYPGTSEHQTGLSVSLSVVGNHHNYEKSFGNTKEGLWLKNNAYRFGFIIRYPENKQNVTGISYSPWQLRYVGKDMAKKLHDGNMTLEEYYQ